MEFTVFFVIIGISIYLLKRYLGDIASFFLCRYFRCETVRLQGCTLFSIKHAKFVFKDGITIEIESFQLNSSFLSQDHSKPISLTLDDIRIESQSALSGLNGKFFGGTKKNTISSTLTEKTNNRFLQFLQYAGARINCVNIVLLEAIPDCLLHVSFENLQLETYRYKEGLQVEVSYKLAQAKLFVRNFHRSVCLMEMSLAGLFSLEMAETKFEVRKLRVVLNNPRFSVFDDIFSYLSTHKSTKSSGFDSVEQMKSKNQPFSAINSLQSLPNLKFEIDCLTIQFIAVLNTVSTRTMSVAVFRTEMEFMNSNRMVSINLKELVISDHASMSHFRCVQMSANIMHFVIADIALLRCEIDFNLQNPSLVLYQHDLVWWMDYVSRLNMHDFFASSELRISRKIDANADEFQHRFADDFSRDFPSHRIEEALKQQKTLGSADSSKKTLADVEDNLPNKSNLELSVQLGLNDFEGQLRSTDGAAIVFGIELATFVGNNSSEQFEFGVESLWCHRATDVKPDFKLDLSRHRWGTAIAVGGGLAELSKSSDGIYQLLIQLDECHFEWEESMVLQLAGFVHLLLARPSKNSTDLSENSIRTSSNSASLTRDDSWSSISESHSLNQNNDNVTGQKCKGLVVKISAKRLNLFLTARQSIFLVFTVDNWRFDLDSTNGNFICLFDNLHIGQSDMKKCEELSDSWWCNPKTDVSKADIRCGGVEKLSVKLLHTSSDCRELFFHSQSSVELIWSTSVHLILLETVRTAKEVVRKLRDRFASHSLTQKQAQSTKTMLISASSEFPVEFGFVLPQNHIMRWIVPSIHFEKAANFSAISAPTFLIEMDGNIILNVENPMIRVSAGDVVMNLGRQEFKQLTEKTNKVWFWSANAFELVFPYGYNFADAFDEVINAMKWVKLVHGFKSQPFRADHRLPADVRISFKKVSLQMNDDPFEICLQNIYEVMMDEVFERERRRQMLEAKIAQLKKEDSLFPKAKVDALHNSLIKKDAQIYVERIRKIQQQPERCLMLWTIRDFEVHIFADAIFNSKENVVKHIRKFNPESSLPSDCDFSTLWARAVELDVAESSIHFRDYPLSYMIVRDAHYWGILAAAEQLAGDRAVRQQYVETPAPWGRYSIDRNMCPLKFYYDLACEIEELSSTYGPCWEPCLTMVSLCWNLVNSASKDPSDPLPFWDKARLLLHGQFSMLCKKLVTSMLASTDPYNDTELIELSWENFEFDWTSGEFRIQTDLDAFIRTASKYDDSRLFHLPKCKFAIQLDWDCLGDPHDHHSIAPCAPNKLPDYSTNVKHDSFRAFRSNNFSMIMRFEVKKPTDGENFSDRQCPQILLYANTFKCLEFMKNTLTTVNRPVKRGALFDNLQPAKRAQLSAHLKNVNLSVALPRFLISYWMSFSSPFGFRMISDSLHLTMSAILHISPVEKGDGISRRARSIWKISHMSAQLESAQIHLFGDKRQPISDNLSSNDTPDSFFVGLSRLNYVRECCARGAPKSSPRLTLNLAQSVVEDNVVHRLTVHDFKASWTLENRDICLVIAEGVQRAHVLRKILDNEAMKMFQFTYDGNPYGGGGQGQKPSFPQTQTSTGTPFSQPSTGRGKSLHNNTTAGQPLSSSPMDDGEEMLWKLVDEAGTNLVAYSEETVEHPTDSLHGVALCATDDVRLTNWQIDLLNSQLVLKGCGRAGFILVTAARASVTQRFHYPIWRHAQLLLKRSWCAVLSGMQYFAPLVIDQGLADHEFRWLGREVIEEKTLSDPSVNDKVNNYSATGEAVGGVVADPFLKNNYQHHQYPSTSTTASSTAPHSELQLQRVASRCSCQLFFCYYSDTINMEKPEEEDIFIPSMNRMSSQASQENSSTWGRHDHQHHCEEVDCFTLKHNMLEVSTNSEQYQMIIDIVNNLVLFVDPKKTQAEENRRRLWFRLAKKSKLFVKEKIVNMQNELREVVSIVRSLERQSYFLNKELLLAPGDPTLCSTNAQLQTEIDEYKTRQNALIDDLATMISCYKEKEVEEQAAAHRLRLLQQQQQQRQNDGMDAQSEFDNFETPQALIARRFEVCFEDCIWRLTESDGQISLTEMQIRNFLYTRTARIDNSGDHLLEVGMVKVLNLLPNSKYKETLAKLPITTTESGSAESPTTTTDKTPSIRVICRELPPVGGISIKEHFEVNIVPMNAQITYRFFEKMMAFFFPGRNIDKEDQQNLDVTDEQPSQQGFSLARRFRGAVNNSFRTAGASSSASNGGGARSTNSVDYLAICDEIDKMKERAKKNKMFVYIIIPPVPFIVSYKGNKDKNIEDVDRFTLTFPIFEYHDKNWTWLDLALAVKQRCKRIILQQLFTQKVLRKRIMGVERVSLPNIETVDEEEKKRIVLGMSVAEDKTKRKKKT